VASLGILLGPCPLVFTDDAPAFELAAVPAFLMAAALADDLVTRVGRDSDDVTLPAILKVLALGLLAGIRRAGSSSSSSSRSESTATRFAWGVFRGCPGGAMALAFAVAVAICLLGVTGGIDDGIVVAAIGVICIASGSSSVSAGGVAGVTSGNVVIAAAA
jgi:hypothetical protein